MVWCSPPATTPRTAFPQASSSPVIKSPAITCEFTQQPTNTAVRASIAPAITVTAENSSGVDTTATGSITLALGTSTGTGTLSGTLTEPLVSGVATFSDLSIDSGGDSTPVASDSVTPPITPVTSVQFEYRVALTWTAPAMGLNWSDAKNWDMDVAPVDGDSLLFPTARRWRATTTSPRFR